MDQKITFIVEEKETTIEATELDRSILDLAIIHQVNPPYSCLEGICSTCEAKVMQGSVRTLPGFETEDHPLRVKTCQSFPLTFPLKISFDR